LVVVCVDCESSIRKGLPEGVRMQAVEGSYGGPSGFIFQCPRCKRKVALACVPELYAESIEIVPPERRRKLKPGGP
jgi:hypothetical protein